MSERKSQVLRQKYITTLNELDSGECDLLIGAMTARLVTELPEYTEREKAAVLTFVGSILSDTFGAPLDMA